MLPIIACNTLFILTCFLVGSVCSGLCFSRRQNQYFACLENIFWGLVIIVTVFSLIVTGFKTVNVVTLPLLFYMVYTNWQNRKLQLRINNKALVSVIAVSVLAFLTDLLYLYYFKNISAGNFDMTYTDIISYGDFAFYGDTADNMLKHSFEGIQLNYFEQLPADSYSIPYHYFDLWINAMQQYFFGFSRITTFVFLFRPLAYTIAFLSLASLIYEAEKANHFWTTVFAFLLLFPLHGLHYSGFITSLTVIQFPKIFTGYACVALFIGYYKSNEIRNAAIILCLLPVFSILAAPHVLSLVFLCGLYLFIKDRNNKPALEAVFISCYVGAAILLFYALAGNLFFHEIESGRKFISAKSTGMVPPAVNGTRLFRYLFSYIPLLVFLVINVKSASTFLKKEYKLLIFLFVLYGSGLLLSKIVKQLNPDGLEIKYFPSAVLPVLAIALFLPFVFRLQKPVYRNLSFVMLFSALLYSAYCFYDVKLNKQYFMSVSFRKQVNNIIPDGSMVAYVYNEEHMRKPLSYKAFIAYEGLQFPLLLENNLKMVNLSIPVNADSMRYKTYVPVPEIVKSPFYRFAQRQGIGDMQTAQKQFLQQHHIQYIALDKGLDTSSFYRSLGNIVCKDSVTQISLLHCW